MARAAREREKDNAKQYVESRIAQVNSQNHQLEEETKKLSNILKDTLSVDDFLAFNKLKRVKPIFSGFSPGAMGIAAKEPLLNLPPEPSGIQKLIPGTKSKYEQEVKALI